MEERVLLRRQWSVASELGQEKTVMRAIAGLLAETRLSAARVDEIETAVSEAVLNAIEHGNGCDKNVYVNVTLVVRADRCTVNVCDRGFGISLDLESALPPQAKDRIHSDNPRGWGLSLIKAFADSVRIVRCDGGSCLEMVFFEDDAMGRVRH